MFYFFQGSLWLGLAGPLDVVELALGGMFIFLAVPPGIRVIRKYIVVIRKFLHVTIWSS